jgi:hypothetical protein
MSMAMVVSLAALVLAAAAWGLARRTARQLAQLTDLYWRLKYDHGELKGLVVPRTDEAAPVRETFVPLTNLRRPGA